MSDISWPSFVHRSPELGFDFFELGLSNINGSDHFEVDGGQYLWGSVDTFIDEDYVMGMRIVVQFRHDLDQAPNHYLDDLFIYRCPSFVRPFWVNSPKEFFDYGTEMEGRRRRERFVRWYHEQGWAQDVQQGDWTGR